MKKRNSNIKNEIKQPNPMFIERINTKQLKTHG